MWGLAALIVAAGASAVTLVAILPILRRRVLDVPNHRSSHAVPVPRAGGVAVLAGIIAGWVVAWLAHPGLPTAGVGVMIGVCGLALIGLIDDLRPLGVGVRLLGQTLCAGFLLSSFTFEYWWFPLLLIFVVGYVNSTNFMDGVNGITAGTSAVAATWFAWVGFRVADDVLVVGGLTALGSVVAFGIWNVTGRVFLGDVGSYLLGGLLAAMAVRAWAQGSPWFVALAPLVLVVLDSSITLIKRVSRGDRVGVAHRDHVYQRLADGGISHTGVSILAVLVSSTLCAAAAGAWMVENSLLMAAMILVLVLSCVTYLRAPHWVLVVSAKDPK